MTRTFSLHAMIGAALAACGCGAVFGATPPSTPPNVLLITVDTLRADHLSCYGYAWQTSPNIDKLAREGTRFERAYTVIPLTGPAHLSLFTSRYPQEHGAVRNGLAIGSERPLVTLPQVLRANGYLNAGFVSGWPLIGRLTRINEWFDHYDEDLDRRYQLVNTSRWAEDVTPRAINWLKQNGKSDKPFFLWVHYFDPHSPYDFREHFADLPRNGTATPRVVSDGDMQQRIKSYDTEVAYMDWYMGKLLGTLDEMGLTNSTLVVLTADHGESLGEHEYVGHGRHLYENIVRIPLIMRLPGKVKAGHVASTPVSILDIAPTITDLTVRKQIDQKRVPLTYAGRSLVPAVSSGSKLTQRRIYNVTFPGKKGFAPGWISWLWINGEEMPLRFGYIDGWLKYVWSPEDEKLSAFEIKRDPHENQPREIRAGNATYAAETSRLKNWFAKTEARSGEQVISDKDLEVLKSLGYVQ